MNKEPKTQAHTEGEYIPLPFRQVSGDIVDTIGNYVFTGSLHGKSIEERNTYTKFAVKACNSHDELVEALRAVKDYWDSGNFTRRTALSSKVEQALKNTEEGK